MSRDKYFDGTYKTSRYADGTLEEDIVRAMGGVIVTETPTGGLCKESDSRIDVWGKGQPGGPYPHHYFNGPNDYGTAPDSRFDKK